MISARGWGIYVSLNVSYPAVDTLPPTKRPLTSILPSSLGWGLLTDAPSGPTPSWDATTCRPLKVKKKQK